MKTLLLSLLITLTAFAGQPAAVAPKPPVGVPADAKFFGGKWYRVYVEKGVSWHRARDKCKALGGQLVTVPDAPTWEFVKSLTPASVWMGATDEKTEGVWKWVDGTPVGFTGWIGAGADNSNGREHYLTTHRGGWNDAPNSGSFATFQVVGFLCEWRGR